MILWKEKMQYCIEFLKKIILAKKKNVRVRVEGNLKEEWCYIARHSFMHEQARQLQFAR